MCTKSSVIKLSLTMLMLSSILCARAQDAARIVERGPHHRIVEQEFVTTNRLGKVETGVGQVIELETGMHYWDGQEWLEAEELVELAPGGAVAVKGQHQVKFSADAKSKGAIEIIMPDGRAVRAHVIGLSYYDAKSGQSVLLGEIKSSQGFIIGRNQVLYPEVFDGIGADLRYTYTKGAIEQDIILRQRPPSPAEFGMNPATTRLEVLTEFIDLPEHQRTKRLLKAVESPLHRQQMVEPDLIDEKLDFGLMHMGVGKAFPVSGGRDTADSLRTAKNLFRTEDGRTVLAEAVEWEAVSPQLRELEEARLDRDRMKLVKNGRAMAATPKQLPYPAARKMLYAAIEPKKPGYVIDWTLSGSLTNQTFATMNTYLINGSVTLSGTTTLEAGAIIKYPTNNTAEIVVTGPFVCTTKQYVPAIFTAQRDTTVGLNLGSTAIGTNYFGKSGLVFQDGPVELSNVRFLYLREAIRFDSGSGDGHVVKHAQFRNCLMGVAANESDFWMQNALMDRVLTNFTGVGGGNATGRCEHVTLHRSARLYTGTLDIFATNSVLVAITNLSSPVLAYCETNAYGTNVFKEVGGGLHYLANGSTLRDVGTTNITGGLLTDLASRTTLAPILWTTNITSPTVFSPQALPDADVPDLGYHYDPLDYLVGDLWVNDRLDLTNGVVVAGYEMVGMAINGQLVSVGTPIKPNMLTEYLQAQENHYGTSNSGDFTPLIPVGENSVAKLSFTRFQNEVYRYGKAQLTGGSAETARLELNHCEFFGAPLGIKYPVLAYFTNCLFVVPSVTFDVDNGQVQAEVHNSTIRANDFNFYGGSGWVVKNCALEVPNFYASGSVISSHNAYSGTNVFTGTSGNNLTNQVFNFQVGPLGNYYLPTNSVLINAGSTSATNVGLYHFTVLTSNVKETNSVVDIGYHYVAVDSNGLPIDTDEDGRPDYFEDANGNGVVDAGEESFLIPDFDRDGVPDWQDGDPSNPNIGVLSITVDSPVNGGVLQ